MTDETLQSRVERLESRVSALENELDEIKENGQSPAGTLDHYDGQVLDELTVGEVYGLNNLRRFYKRAGIRDDSKLKSRIEYITTEYCETVGQQRWRFVGREEEK